MNGMKPISVEKDKFDRPKKWVGLCLVLALGVGCTPQASSQVDQKPKAASTGSNAAVQPAGAAAPADQSAADFWIAFRAAALSRDAAAVASMTAQALVLRGETDAEPARQVAGTERTKVVLQELERSIFPGAGQKEVSLHTLLLQTEVLPETAQRSASQFRVHNLVFRRAAAGGWKLAQIYVGDD